MEEAVILIPVHLTTTDRFHICRALRDRIAALYREFFIYYNRDLHLAHSPDTEYTEELIVRSLAAYQSVHPEGLAVWIEGINNKGCKGFLQGLVEREL